MPRKRSAGMEHTLHSMPALRMRADKFDECM
jgi:hypothetical protein